MKKVLSAVSATALAFALISCSSFEDSGVAETTVTPTEEGQSENVVELQADGSEGAEVTVTFMDKGFETTQHSSVETPWAAQITSLSSEDEALGINMTAQVTQQGGSVSCRILWNGEVVSEDDSSGPFAIADCSLPRDLP